jgi:hypothetical protein
MQTEYREAQYRKRSYLCFKYLISQTEGYISQMTKLNWALRSAYAAQLSGVATEESVVIFKGLVLYRNGLHLSYMKNLIQNNYCSFPETKDFVKNPPYKVKNVFVLDTSIDETTRIRAPIWKNTITMIPKNIRVSHIFLLSAKFSINNPFLPNLKYVSEEIGKKVLPNLSL